MNGTTMHGGVLAKGLGALCAAVGCVAGGQSATVSTNDAGVVTIDVAAGETYAHAFALKSDVSSVVKTGAGTATFGVAASGFSGTIELREGVADFAADGAYGMAAIDVADGAQMLVSHAGRGQQTTSVYGTVTIRGAGPDGTGALVYSNSAMGDNLFKKIVLADDATMGGKRFGALELDFQGHVLTWIGTNMMALNSTWRNVGGYVHKGAADMCFQLVTFGDATAVNAPFTLASTGGGHISFWNSWTAVPMALTVAEDSRIVANSGGGTSCNVWSGPIEIAAGRTLQAGANGTDKSLRLSGAIGGAGTLKSQGSGVVYLDNPGNSWTGGLEVPNGCVYAPAPSVLPEWQTPERIRLTGGALVAVVGKPISGLSVQDTWTADDVRTLMANVGTDVNTDTSVGFHVEPGADFTYPHPVSTNVSKYGAGALRLTGGTSHRSSFYVEEGVAVLSGDAPRDFHNFVQHNDGVVLHESGDTTVAGYIRIANRTSDRCAFRQTGGSFAAVGGDFYMAEAVGARGSFEVLGGAAALKGAMYVAKATNTFGAIVQKGGVFKLKSGVMNLGVSGDAVMYVGGGTNDHMYATTYGTMTAFMGTGRDGSSTLTVDGTGTLFRVNGLVMGYHDSPQTNVLNVANGGVFASSRFYAESYVNKASHSNGVFNVVNVDGGVIRPLFGWGWNHQGGTYHVRDVSKWVVYENGMTLDTSVCSNSDMTVAAEHQFSDGILAPTGKGVVSIALPTSDAFKKEVYTAPARVRIFDATGWGATAFADFDPETGTLAGVKVTSRGCDYSDSPVVLLDSADGKKTYVCTCRLAANVGGGLTKRGAQLATLFGTNTYVGATCVEEGMLKFNAAENVPTNSHMRVKAGATLQLPCATPLKSIGGAGRIAGGDVVLTAGCVADAADLNAKAKLTVEGAVSFADGAVVSLADPESLAQGPSRWPLVTATDAIEGTPALDRTTLPAPFGVSFSSDRKTLYLTYPNATIIVFR